MADTRRRRKRGREGEDGQEEKRGKESVKDLPFPIIQIAPVCSWGSWSGTQKLVSTTWMQQILEQVSIGKGTHRLVQVHLQTQSVKWGFSRTFHLGPSIKDFEAPFTKMDDDECIMVNQLPQIVMQYLRRAQISYNILQQFTTKPMF